MRCPIIADVSARLAALALLCTPLVTAAAAQTDRHSWTVALPEGRTLRVSLTVGQVRIVGEPRQDAAIEVVRTAPTAAAFARLPVRLVESAGEVTFTAEQVDGGTDPALRTDVSLRVPVDAHIARVHVLEGAVSISRLTGKIDAAIARGPIQASHISGVVRLQTDIGDVTVTSARLTPGGLLRLRTFNGNVRLGLAAPPRDARIMALALNGSIRSEIPLTMKNTWGPRWGETTLGTGEPVISIDVVTGTISIGVVKP
jgi:hypothetical protein